MKKKGYAMGGIVPAAKTTDKAGGVSSKPSKMAMMDKPKMPKTGRDQMVGGPGMPRLARGGMMKGKKK